MQARSLLKRGYAGAASCLHRRRSTLIRSGVDAFNLRMRRLGVLRRKGVLQQH
jgi:hypothetical protein